MADFIYLLQTRLTAAQFSALERVREVARERGMTVFLAGDAVRDLIAGYSVRDLGFSVQGNALKLKKDFAKAGFTLTGEYEPAQVLFFSAPGGARLEVASTLSATYPKPGKAVYKPATILDDLRRRDFTANAMAISLNEGSYGLLMDPLNGVADTENMELRLVSNYGFIEEPARMIRAVRLEARLGWHMEERTRQRYENGKEENYIAALDEWHRGYETEEIVHEEDPLRALRRLEAEGWMKVLFPAWTAAKANETELNKLRDVVGQLQVAGIHPDPSAAYFPLLTAKLAPKEVAALKKSFVRPGFVEQIEALEGQTKTFAAEFSGKGAATPSAAWKMLYAAVPEQVLQLAYSSKSAPVRARFETFFNESPQARQRIPYQTMQEMRITPELPVYEELIEKLFFAIMDAQLETPEAVKAFLEPHSPPAPPPPVTLRRRPVKRETKAPRPKKSAAVKTEEAAPQTGEAVAEGVSAPTEKVAPVVKEKPVAKASEKKAAVAAKPAPAPAKKEAAPAKKAVAKKAAAPVKVAKKAAPAKGAVAKKPAKKVVAAKKVTASAKKAVVKKTAAPAKKMVGKKAVKAAVKPSRPAKKAAPSKAAKKAPGKKIVAKKAAAKRR